MGVGGRDRIRSPSHTLHQFYIKNIYKNTLAGVAQWIERRPANQSAADLIPIRAHAWVAGQAPRWGRVRDNCTLTFLSLSFYLLLSLKINK